MSNEVTRKSKPVRKATFTVVNKNGERYFKPANKRAQKYGKLFTGNRKGLLQIEQVMSCLNNSHLPYRFRKDGTLARITF